MKQLHFFPVILSFIIEPTFQVDLLALGVSLCSVAFTLGLLRMTFRRLQERVRLLEEVVSCEECGYVHIKHETKQRKRQPCDTRHLDNPLNK